MGAKETKAEMDPTVVRANIVVLKAQVETISEALKAHDKAIQVLEAEVRALRANNIHHCKGLDSLKAQVGALTAHVGTVKKTIGPTNNVPLSN